MDTNVIVNTESMQTCDRRVKDDNKLVDPDVQARICYVRVLGKGW